MKKIVAILLLLACCTGRAGFAQPTSKGTALWLGFMENLDYLSNGPPAFSILISSDVNTSGTVTMPAASLSINFTVAAGQVTELVLPSAPLPYYAFGSENVDTMGILITANDPVSVSTHHERLYFSDASIVLPETELGDAYMIMAHSDDFYAVTSGKSEFVIVATENNTWVDITPSAVTLGGKPAGVTFSVLLDKGNTYQVQSAGDLTGTVVKASGKKIAVFSGSRTAAVNCNYADNHLFDEEYPVANWGTEYMVCPFYAQSNIFRVLAAEDQTDVYINCTHVAALNKSEHFDTLMDQPAHIVATRPVMVGQFERGADCSLSIGDPNFLVYPPLSHVATKRSFNALVNNLPGNNFPYHFVTVFVRSADAATLLLDNVSAASSLSPVPANPGYSFGVIDLPVGTHTLQCDSGFLAFMTGFRQYDAYSYTLGYDQLRRPDAALQMAHDTDSLCTNRTIHFTGSSTLLPTSWTWSFGDGSSSTDQNPSHTYSSAGTYHVTLAVFDGSGCPHTVEQSITIGSCTTTPEDCEIYVPNAFSPNDDGVNDVTFVHGACIQTCNFKVFDRWGTLVFHSTNPQQGWDGTFKGQKLESAVFMWTLEVTTDAGTFVRKKGNIAIVR